MKQQYSIPCQRNRIECFYNEAHASGVSSISGEAVEVIQDDQVNQTIRRIRRSDESDDQVNQTIRRIRRSDESVDTTV
jgi:hypothetical protein